MAIKDFHGTFRNDSTGSVYKTSKLISGRTKEVGTNCI